MSTVLGLMDLRGRTAIITGATGGIGRNMATVIAEMGGSLILVDRIGTNYDSLKKKISDSYSVAVDCIDCDLESETSRNNLINKIVKSKKNIEQIAQIMYKVIKDSKFKNDLIAKGYQNIKRFSWQKCASQTLQILTNL